VLPDSAGPARRADGGELDVVAGPADLLGHVSDIGTPHGDVVVIVVAEANAGAVVALGVDTDTGPGGAAGSNSAQAINAVVDAANVGVTKPAVAVAVLRKGKRKSKRSRRSWLYCKPTYQALRQGLSGLQSRVLRAREGLDRLVEVDRELGIVLLDLGLDILVVVQSQSVRVENRWSLGVRRRFY
jgi:hypothetical protein